MMLTSSSRFILNGWLPVWQEQGVHRTRAGVAQDAGVRMQLERRIPHTRGIIAWDGAHTRGRSAFFPFFSQDARGCYTTRGP